MVNVSVVPASGSEASLINDAPTAVPMGTSSSTLRVTPVLNVGGSLTGFTITVTTAESDSATGAPLSVTVTSTAKEAGGVS